MSIVLSLHPSLLGIRSATMSLSLEFLMLLLLLFCLVWVYVLLCTIIILFVLLIAPLDYASIWNNSSLQYVCVCVCVSFVCSHSICMGKGLGWLCPPPHWLLHSTCYRCTLCSGGSPTCLVGAGSAYLYSGITPFAMVSGLPFAPLPSVSLGTTSLLPPTLLSSTSQLPVLPAQGLPSQSGLSLSLLSEPVPARLVKRIQGSRFVEMWNLLGDNIAVLWISS